MEILHDLNNSKEFTKDSTIIIGNFDGVHLGHQEIIRKCSQIASSNRFGILTFNPSREDPYHFWSSLVKVNSLLFPV